MLHTVASRRLAALVLVALVSTALVTCVPGPPDHVRIGLVAPLSGQRAYLGREVHDGAVLAVEDINEHGGLLGESVELVVRDDSDLVDIPGHLADLAERSRVTAVIGPETPGVLLGPRNPLSRRDVPAVLPTGFTGDLREAATTVVRTVPGAREQARSLGRWLSEVRGVDAASVLVADPVEGSLARDALVDALEETGVGVAAVVEADAAAPDLGPAISRLRRASADAGAVLLWAPPPLAARATIAVRDQDWDVQVMVPATAFVAEYRSLAGEASEGVVFAFPFRDDWFTGRMERWFVRWHLRHGIGALAQLDTLVLDLPVAGAATYDAVHLVAAAVRQAGTREPAAVAAALADVRHDGLLRDYAFGGERPREAWSAADLYVARFHHFAVVYDADPRRDRERQRRFYEFQVEASYLPDDVLEGPAGDLVRRLLRQGRGEAPPYEPPDPPPGPVARP